MELKERAAYLKGLMEGLEIGDSKEGKVLKAMYDPVSYTHLEEDLDKAVCTAVEKNIGWMRECGKSIDPLSLEALEDLKRGMQTREDTHE